MSAREKFYIDSHYQHLALGDLEAALKTYALWAQIYPRDYTAVANLGFIYRQLGEHERALTANQKALKLIPGGALYADLVASYVTFNRLDEAKATAQEAQAKHLGTHLLYFVYFLQHDAAGMEREAATPL